MKIYFMLAYARRKAERPILADVIANLRREDFDVATGVAESLVISPEELRVEADVYVLKSHSAMWLNLAAVLDAQQARILNEYPACVATNNKIRSTSRLAAAGVPIPRSWVTGDLSLMSEIAHRTPLLLKPNIGRNGDGIKTIMSAADIDGSTIEDGMLVQEMIMPVEDEIKLYVIGEQVFGIRKDDDGVREELSVDDQLADIALRAGRALGLEIYGLDVIFGQRGPVVVDVNYFPSFRGVRDAVTPLTEHIIEFARR